VAVTWGRAGRSSERPGRRLWKRCRSFVQASKFGEGPCIRFGGWWDEGDEGICTVEHEAGGGAYVHDGCDINDSTEEICQQQMSGRNYLSRKANSDVNRSHVFAAPVKKATSKSLK
jgi:hypothetical protein